MTLREGDFYIQSEWDAWWSWTACPIRMLTKHCSSADHLLDHVRHLPRDWLRHIPAGSHEVTDHGLPAYRGLFLTAYHISDSWCHSDLIGRMIVASWMVGKFGQGIVLMEHAGNLPSGMLDIQTEVPWWCWGSCWLLGAATHCTWKKSTSGMGPWSNHRLWKLSKRSAWNLVTILHIVPAGKGGISTESHIPFCRVIRRDGYGAEDPQTHTWHTLICN